MTTKIKKRINITVDSDIESALLHIAKRDGIQVTTKAAELLRLALELEEDLALASIADSRARTNSKLFSHEAAWKR